MCVIISQRYVEAIAIAGAVHQAAIFCRQTVQAGGKGALGQSQPFGIAETQRRFAQGDNHHGVPVSQTFIVAAGAGALVAGGAQHGQIGFKRIFIWLDFRCFEAVGNVAAFKIAGFGNVISVAEIGCFRPQQGLDFRFLPDIKQTFFAFCIGVKAGGETAIFKPHVARQPVNRGG